ncbi:hypothetical protein [Streptomyces sp. NPDC048442]
MTADRTAARHRRILALAGAAGIALAGERLFLVREFQRGRLGR